jgi:hypothetical protein
MPTMAGWHVPPQLMSINTISAVFAYIHGEQISESIHTILSKEKTMDEKGFIEWASHP